MEERNIEDVSEEYEQREMKNSSLNTQNEQSKNLKEKRYCNGKMKKGHFICMNVCIAIAVFFAVLLPVLHQVVIPNYLQKTVDNFGKDTGQKKEGSYTKISKAAITELNPNELHFNVDVKMSPMMGLGIKVGLTPFSIHMVQLSGTDEMQLGKLEIIDPINLTLNKELHVLLNAKIIVDPNDQTNSKALISKLSSDEGMKDISLKINFAPGIKVFGWTLYHSLPLHRNIEMEAPSMSKLMSSEKSQSRPAAKEEDSILVYKDINNSQLQANFAAEDISTLASGWALLWKQLKTVMDDRSASIQLELAFENISPFSFVDMAFFEFYVEIEYIKIFKVGFNKMGLKEGFNDDFTIELTLTFIDDLIDPNKVREAIELASKNYADGTDFKFGFAGPMKFSSAQWVEQITSDMRVGLKYNDVKSMLNSSTSKSADSSGSSMGNTDITLSVLADQIFAAVQLNLPALENIKPPQNVGFPYEMKLGLYAKGEKFIDIKTSPVTVSRLVTGMQVSSGVTVVPVNTDSAATALANTVNPVLAGTGEKSVIGIRDFAFALPGQPNFKWCDNIFANRVVDYTLPKFDRSILFSTSKSADDGVSKKIYQGVINIAQLNDRAGFGASGELKIDYPADKPNIYVDIGFLHFDTVIESTPMLALELPAGIQISKQSPNLKLDATAILSKESALPKKLTSFIKAYQSSGESQTAFPSSMGVTNFLFGASSQQHIITFSKIGIFASQDDLKSKFGGPKVKSAAPPRTEPVAKMGKADLTMKSATDISISLSMDLKNPMEDVTLSLGSLSLATNLDGKNLMFVKISPIEIGLGASKLDMNIDLKLSDGTDGMNVKIAEVADAVINDKFDNKIVAEITGVTLIPPSGNVNAVIDQLAGFTVVSQEVGKYLKDSKNAGANSISNEVPAIDTSALKLDPELDTSKSYELKNTRVAAKAHAILSLSSEVSYGNPLPVSVDIPFFGINAIVVEESPVFSIAVTGLKIVPKGNGQMKPEINLGFEKDPQVKLEVGRLFQQYDNKKLESKILVKGFTFGTPGNENRLLEHISLDLSSKVKEIFEKESESPDSGTNDSASSATSNEFEKFFELDAEFRETKDIVANVKLPVEGPKSVTIDIPFLKVSSFINKEAAFNIALNEIKSTFVEGEKQILNLTTIIGVNDTPELAGSISSIFAMAQRQQPIPGTIGGGNFIFGASAEDYVDVFSLIAIHKDIETQVGDKIRSRFDDSKPSTTAKSNTEGEMFVMGNVSMEAHPQKRISTKISGKLSIPKKITIRGLGFMSAALGVNGKTVAGIQSPMFYNNTIGYGVQDISLNISTIFSSAEDSKAAVNALANESITHLGEQKSIFTLSGPRFGYDEKSAFLFLSRTVFGYKAKNLINQELMDSINSNLSADKPASQTNTTNSALLLENVDVEVTQEKIIKTNIKGIMKVPDGMDFKMGFIKFGTKINQARFFDMEFNKLAVGSGENKLNLGSVLKIHDTTELADNIAAVVKVIGEEKASGVLNRNANIVADEEKKSLPSHDILLKRDVDDLKGTVGAGYFAFGFDDNPENVIDIFDDIVLDLDVQKVRKLFLKDKTPTSDESDLDKLDFSLKNLQGGTEPGRIIKTSFTAGFKSNMVLNASLTGLNFIAGAGGIGGPSGVATVFHFASNGFNIIPGVNNLDVESQIYFPPSDNVIDVVGAFSKGLLTNLGNTPEKLFATGIQFGTSKESSFQFLSKAVLGIKSADYINQQFVDKLKARFTSTSNATDISSMLLNKLHLSTSPDGSIIVDSGVAMKNKELQAGAKIGFLRATALIDRKPILNYTMPAGITLTSDEQKNVNLITRNIIQFSNAEEIQDSVKVFGAGILENKTDIPTELGVIGFMFGSDTKRENIVDTFAKVAISKPIGEYVPLLNEKYDEIASGLSKVIKDSNGTSTDSIWKNVKFEDPIADVDIPAQNVLGIEVSSEISGLPMDVKIDLPFISYGIAVNRDFLIEGSVENLELSEGSIKSTMKMLFKENEVAYQNLFDVFGQVYFARGVAKDDFIIPTGMSFGASKENVIKTFSKLGLKINIKDTVDSIIARGSKRTIKWWSVATENGIETSLTFPEPDMRWLNVKCQVLAKTRYQKNHEGETRLLTQVPIFDIDFPDAKMVLVPVTENDVTANAIELVAEKFLKFEDFGSDAKHGYLVFTGTNKSVFNVWRNNFYFSNELIMFNPLHIDIVPGFPWDIKEPENFILPIRIMLSFLNGGPFHLDMGEVSIAVEHKGEKLLSLDSVGDWIIRNVHEGANDPNNMLSQGNFRIEIPFKKLNVITLISVIRTLLTNKDLKITMNCYRDGKPISYIPKVFEGVLKTDAFANFGPLLAAILAHTQFEILGINPADIPLVKKLMEEINNWIANHIPGSKSVPLILEGPATGNTTITGNSTSATVSLFQKSPGKLTVIDSPNLVIVAH